MSSIQDFITNAMSSIPLQHIVYYEDKEAENYVLYDGNKVTTQKKMPEKGYYMKRGFEPTHDGLKQYHRQVNVWRDDILNANSFLNIDYFNFNNHYDACVQTMWRLTMKNRLELGFVTDKEKNLKSKLDMVTMKEHNMFEKCRNFGLSYFNERYKKKKVQCIAYDWSSFYPNIIGSNTTKFKMSFKRGSLVKLDEIPDKLKYGIYHVKIKSKIKNIGSLFNINPENHYTHFEIEYARYLMSIGLIYKIKLVKNDEPNALIYNDEDLVETKKIFNYWFRCLNTIKEKCKGNALIKGMMNNSWGSLSANRLKYYTDKEYLNLKKRTRCRYEACEDKKKRNGKVAYIHKEKPYKHQFRLKTFLTSYGRKKMGSKVLEPFIKDCREKVKKIHKFNRYETDEQRQKLRDYIKKHIEEYLDKIVLVKTDGVVFKYHHLVSKLESGVFKYETKYCRQLIPKNVSNIKCAMCKKKVDECEC